MADRVFLVGVVAVVGAHPVESELLGEANELLVERFLSGDPVVLELDVKAVPEHLLVFPDVALGQLDVAGDDGPGDLGAQAPGEADNALGVLGQDLPVGAGVVVEALEPRLRADLDEVVIAGVVGRQQRQVVGLVGVLALGRLLVAVASEEVALHPEDRLDARRPTRLVELERPVHDAVVGDGAGRHVVVGHGLEHLCDTARPIQHRVLRMRMKMNKAQLRHLSIFRVGWAPAKGELQRCS